MSGSGQSASLWRALPGSVITVQPGFATWAQEYGLVITNGKWRHVCRRAANRRRRGNPVASVIACAAPERVIWVAPAVREAVTWAQAYWLVAFASWY
jgi:hypothetical protein